jgi:hypothetical protein
MQIEQLQHEFERTGGEPWPGSVLRPRNLQVYKAGHADRERITRRQRIGVEVLTGHVTVAHFPALLTRPRDGCLQAGACTHTRPLAEG